MLENSTYQSMAAAHQDDISHPPRAILSWLLSMLGRISIWVASNNSGDQEHPFGREFGQAPAESPADILKNDFQGWRYGGYEGFPMKWLELMIHISTMYPGYNRACKRTFILVIFVPIWNRVNNYGSVGGGVKRRTSQRAVPFQGPMACRGMNLKRHRSLSTQTYCYWKAWIG